MSKTPKIKRTLEQHPKKPPRPALNQQWDDPLPSERILNDKDAFEHLKPKLLHNSFVMFDLQFGISLDDIVQSFDPLLQIQSINKLNEIMAPTVPTPIQAFGVPTGSVAMLNSTFAHVHNHPHHISSMEISTDNYGLQSTLNHTVHNPPVVLDTGASTTITPILSDFVTPIKPTSLQHIKGLSGNARVMGEGIVEWYIVDYWNVTRKIRTKAYYVPAAQIRLFSPQSYFQES